MEDITLIGSFGSRENLISKQLTMLQQKKDKNSCIVGYLEGTLQAVNSLTRQYIIAIPQSENIQGIYIFHNIGKISNLMLTCKLGSSA